jgi:Na+-driven multidrug efflux pump
MTGKRDLTQGNISKGLILFALPMIAGNLLQQFYNIADTLIVGRVLGKDALAAVGSAYALMVFLTSIFLGLSMGAGALFSIYYGKKDLDALKSAIVQSFVLIMGITLFINIVVYWGIDGIMRFLSVPAEIYPDMREYLLIIFAGLIATSLYNYFPASYVQSGTP